MLTFVVLCRHRKHKDLQADVLWLENHPEAVASQEGAAVPPASTLAASNTYGGAGGDGGGSGLSKAGVASFLLSMAQSSFPARQQQPQSADCTAPPTAPRQLNGCASASAGGMTSSRFEEVGVGGGGTGSDMRGVAPEDTRTYRGGPVHAGSGSSGGAAGEMHGGQGSEKQRATQLKGCKDIPSGTARKGTDRTDTGSRRGGGGRRGRGKISTRGRGRGRGGRAASAPRGAGSLKLTVRGVRYGGGAFGPGCWAPEV